MTQGDKVKKTHTKKKHNLIAMKLILHYRPQKKLDLLFIIMNGLQNFHDK